MYIHVLYMHVTHSPECHDIVSTGIDPDGKVTDLSLCSHLCLAVCSVHVPPEPVVVL